MKRYYTSDSWDDEQICTENNTFPTDEVHSLVSQEIERQVEFSISPELNANSTLDHCEKQQFQSKMNTLQPHYNAVV